VTISAKTTGLRYWMMRVLHECDHVSTGFGADPVHDLRVALRRCRSMADGMMAMDPDPDWKAMKKEGKRLFRRLGDLRDVQIMIEWLEKIQPSLVAQARVARALPSTSSELAPSLPESQATSVSDVSAQSSENPPTLHPQAAGSQPDGSPPSHDHLPSDFAAYTLLQILRHREAEQKHAARAALEEFDRKQWRHWSRILPQRAARIRLGSAVFKHLALERWTAARELHTRALRNRSQVAFHSSRIGIKRFRYIVENFLPAEHAAWSNDLKHMQDLLGEVHDLDVLWATALSCHVFPEDESRERWHARIVQEQTKRIAEYRQRTIGPNSLWKVWRAGLPQGGEVRQIATRRMKLWAKALDTDFAHSERVARRALELYDGLDAAGLLGSPGITTNGSRSDARDTLYVAALLHDVGLSKEKKGHNKRSKELIKAHPTPLGWKAENMQRAAVVARFHCGALPTRSHKALRDLLPDEQKLIIRLAAILRLANAFDAEHNGHIRRVRIENSVGRAHRREHRTNGFLRKPPVLARNEALVIAADGYTPGSPTAQTIAAERYLLETVLRRPVVVKPSAARAR
jgi:CHAD domain-containing protein/HD superfamily phosphodiesterase